MDRFASEEIFASQSAVHRKIIYAIISNSTVWFEYLAYAFVIIFCLFLFYKANDLYTKELNKFAIDNKSKKKI